MNDCFWNLRDKKNVTDTALFQPEKYFIVKLWRKAADCTDLRPIPLADVVIGFCTVDLKVLTAGLPQIIGCYNIVYFDGKCNGQLQLKLTPLEAIPMRDVLDAREMHLTEEQMHLPLLDLTSLGPDLSLSRTLKRKFTELDEITQRLKARLHDVTSSELISSDDEFENYLNTSVDEVDEEPTEASGDEVDAVKCDFDWLGKNLTEMQKQFVEVDRRLQSKSQTLNELLDRSMPGTSAQTANMYTNGGGGGGGDGQTTTTTTVESLETALKEAVLNEKPKTT